MKRKMKLILKQFSAIVVIGLLVFGLSACKNNSEAEHQKEDKTEQQSKKEKPTTTTIEKKSNPATVTVKN